MSIKIPCREANVPMNVNELMDALHQIFIPKNYDGAPTVYLKRARS